MNLAGIDEAGLGPVLGPYCAGMASFTSPTDDLYTVLEGVIARKPGEGLPAVGDSKRLYTPVKGIGELEKTVLAFYSLLYGMPAHFGEFLSQISPDYPPASPWYESCSNLNLPLCTDDSSSFAPESLKSGLEERGVRFTGITLRLVTAAAFNRGLDRSRNKGALCQTLLAPLMEKALEKEDLSLTVDRQGGRRFYGDWLIGLMPRAPLQATEEGPENSSYRSGSRRIRFLVGGDGFAMETALASLFAKYARECGMILFNRYWRERKKDLKETAGYYTDGMRFIGDLEAAELLPEDRDILIRKK
jgi:hypothetical protein